MPSLNELIRRFYAYRGLTSEGFVYPILTVHALAQGLDLAGVGFAAGSFFVGTLLGEIPIGYLGDRIGRRNGLALGSVLVSLTHLGFAFAHSLAGFVALWGFWGVAATFRSGTTDAWLYDTLSDHGETASFARIHGRSSATFYAAAATTALVGGVLYEQWAPLPFLAAATLTGLGTLIVLTLPEPSASSTNEGFSLADARTALVRVVSNRRVRSFVLLSGVAIAVPETVDVFVQPVALSVGFTPATLGGLYVGLMLAAATGSSVAARIGERFGIGGWFTLGPLLLACGLLGTSVVPVVALPVFLLSRGTNTVYGTLQSTFLNDRITSHGRATTLSGVSMIHALLFFLARTVGGTLANVTSPLVALATFGFVAVGSVVVFRSVSDPFASRGSVAVD
ncbi:MFS transporter [Haladaptatus sp.]|uniref:MFS transporter n=1 Tax=Haladaptatus sp. TaxID=1973141 RepID=UPI003C3D4613